jgi:hypothetical protein
LIGHRTREGNLEDAAEVDALAVAWDTLRLDALPRTASISLITSAAEAV